MNSTQVQDCSDTIVPTEQALDMSFELVVIPVSDVDRAKHFYLTMGWPCQLDYTNNAGFRVVQFTPTGSGTSIMFGNNITTAAPGSAQGLHLIVSDINIVRDSLIQRGIEVREVFHDDGGVFHRATSSHLVLGPNPERKSYASYASFADPDGNGWVLQEVTARLPVHDKAEEAHFTEQLIDVVHSKDGK